MRLAVCILSLLIVCGFARTTKIMKSAQKYTTENFEIKHAIKIKKKLREVSDIAYDVKSDTLYALGDKGDLYHLRPVFKKERLVSVKLLKKYKLKLKKSMKKIDSEGLAIVGGKLAISFERIPKVALFTLDGKEVDDVKLPKKLQNMKTYKGKNQMFEALAYKKSIGLVTAPQSSYDKYHTLYNLTHNETYKFRKNTEISEFEFTPNGNLLVIERTTNKNAKKGRKTKNLVLKHVKFNTADDVLKDEVIVSFKSKNLITKNYEGLTHYKGNQYFMINDNHGKDSTYLVLFQFDEK